MSEGRVITKIEGDTRHDRGRRLRDGARVVKNEEFLGFARAGASTPSIAEGPDAVEALEEERVDLIARIGENIEIVGAARLEAEDDEVLASYVHPPAKKIGVLVRAEKASPELARLVAMHISFANPTLRLARRSSRGRGR